MTPHVLLVDDDPVACDLLSRILLSSGMTVSVLHDGEDLQRQLTRERPSVVLLDIMMPRKDGLSALCEVRAAGDDVPMIFLSARGEAADRAAGLELGADDYLPKPFCSRELLARIHAVLRRRPQPPGSAPERRLSYGFGPFDVDFAARTLTRDGQRLPLRDTEFALLKVFTGHPMKLLSRARLHDRLYGSDLHFRDRSLDVPVWRLRRLIEDDPSAPRYIQTVRGRGYVFVPGPEPFSMEGAEAVDMADIGDTVNGDDINGDDAPRA